MDQKRPTRRSASIGWALGLGLLVPLAACTRVRVPRSRRRPERVRASRGRRTPARSPAMAGQAGQAGRGEVRDGDRGGPADVVRPGGDEQADRVEPVPLRRDRQGGRDRLRPLLGHDRGEALPDRQRLGGRRLRLRQRRPARHLLRHRHAPAAGHGREGPEPALQEPGQRPVPGRDRDVRPRLSRLLPRDHRRRHRQRRRSDVFLCNYGSNVLYLNNGDGTFKDISKSAGIDAPNWSSGGAMLDYDNDGYLDIYVTNYGIWKYPDDHHRVGDAEKKVWLYCVAPDDQDDQAPVLPQQRQRDVHRRLRQGDHRPRRRWRTPTTKAKIRRSGCPSPATTATASAS